MSADYRHVLAHFYGAPWSILPEKLAEIEAVLWRRVSGHRSAPFAFDDDEPPMRSRARGQSFERVGAVGVVKINGTITPRPSVFADFSGGTSAEQIGRGVEAAAADKSIKSIVLDIDSPGGYVAGIPEAADKIFAARKLKPIHAVANHLAASAAYWLASQATDISVSPSAQVGSVGVLAAHIDETKLEELQGVRTTLISNTQSPFKTEGYPQIPLTDDARADMQKAVDDYAAMFLDAIARGRGIRTSAVVGNFGQGRVKLAKDAVASGMANRIATLETVLNDLRAGGKLSSGSRAVAATAATAAGSDAATLRRLAAMAAAAGVRTPPAGLTVEQAKAHFARSVTAKLVGDEMRTDEARRREEEEAARNRPRFARLPATRAEIQRAAQLAARGLPTA